MKPIAIVDFFYKDQEGEDVFLRAVDRIKSSGLKVLLVTGGKITDKIQRSVDYVLYNSDNFLFENFDYLYFHPWNFRTVNDNHVYHSFYFSTQRHGLAVLINIFNSVKFAKSLGYTHFHRVLHDTMLGPECLEFMRGLPELCESQGKKSLFYFNEQEHADVKGEYFFSEIDFFLGSIPCIRSEEDFRSVLVENFGSLQFLITEKYLHYFLIKNGGDLVWRKNSDEFVKDFPDADLLFQGSSISELNFHPKYRGAPTRITKVKDSDSIILYTTNYSNSGKYRKVICKDKNNNILQEIDFVVNPCSWNYHFLEGDLESIDVYEEGKIIYTEDISESKNYIEFTN
jgi:hypothetical protein